MAFWNCTKNWTSRLQKPPNNYPMSSATFPVATGLEFANSWFVRSMSNRQLSKPGSEAYSDPTLRALKPALRTLSSARCINICRCLLSDEPADGWKDEDLVRLSGWSEYNENLVLMTLAALCRTGVFMFEHKWKSTSLGNEMKFNWHKMPPNEAMRKQWSPYLRSEYLRALKWAWSALRKESDRAFLTRLLSDANGFRHNELPLEGIDRHQAMSIVAASASVGALWFTGWSWEPTLYGAWLINHPDSPLNSNEI